MSRGTKNRCIHLFPEVEGIDVINRIRSKYDPLYTKIQPHITLVFPFISDLSGEELEEHIRTVLSGEKEFEIELQGIRAVESFGYYLYLDVIKGEELIKHLHQKLYSGVLSDIKPLWLDTNPYTPHMTVGKFESRDFMLEAEKSCNTVKQKFKSFIKQVWVEEIDLNDNSIIELKVDLGEV